MPVSTRPQTYENLVRTLDDRKRDEIVEGEREYWVVDPDAEAITLCTLTPAGSFEVVPSDETLLRSRVLSGFELDVASLFREAT